MTYDSIHVVNPLINTKWEPVHIKAALHARISKFVLNELLTIREDNDVFLLHPQVNLVAVLTRNRAPRRVTLLEGNHQVLCLL